MTSTFSFTYFRLKLESTTGLCEPHLTVPPSHSRTTHEKNIFYLFSIVLVTCGFFYSRATHFYTESSSRGEGTKYTRPAKAFESTWKSATLVSIEDVSREAWEWDSMYSVYWIIYWGTLFDAVNMNVCETFYLFLIILNSIFQYRCE